MKYFFIKRGGVWIQVQTCRPCRKGKVEQRGNYRTIWKGKSREEREKASMARRARELNCPVIIPFTRLEIIRRDGLNCYICGVLLSYETATIDHKIALSRGGFHCPSNAKIACLKCNQVKNNKNYAD